MTTPTRLAAHRVRIMRRHKANDFDYHEMRMLRTSERGPEVVYRDTIGRKGKGYTRWHRVICNNPDCPAEMLVQLDTTITAIAAEVDMTGDELLRDTT